MRQPSDGISIVHGVVAILRQADSVVMVQQQGPDDRQPFWVLPGGMVEAGELITNALMREVQEEVGVQVTTITQLACLIQMDRPDHRSQTLLFAFEVGAWQGTLRSHDPDDEILAVELVPLAEAIRRLAGKGGWPGMQTSLLTYLRGDVQAGTVWCYREDEAGQHLVGRFPA